MLYPVQKHFLGFVLDNNNYYQYQVLTFWALCNVPCIYEVPCNGGSLPLKDGYPGVSILRSLAGWGISGLAQHHVHYPAVHSHVHSPTQPMGFIGTVLKAEFTTAYLHWAGFT